MGSHGQDGHGELPEELREQLRAMQQDFQGAYPEGRLSPDDQGALAIAVGVERGKVVLAFAKPIDWIAFGPEQARAVAKMILQRAQDCDGIETHVRRVTSE
jgi:hypothetical protein